MICCSFDPEKVNNETGSKMVSVYLMRRTQQRVLVTKLAPDVRESQAACTQ
jgi:hypothetical protein